MKYYFPFHLHLQELPSLHFYKHPIIFSHYLSFQCVIIQVYLSIIILMSENPKQPKQNRTTNYTNIIKLHNNDDFFSQRVIQLKGITSYHMFPIDAAAIGDYPMIIYLEENQYSLDSLMENNVELTTLELKAIIWQITKLMIDCQKVNVNHFRLYPNAITFKEKYKPSKPFFIRIRDFSLGKEFQSVKEGKVQEIFEYLHPDLSILNKIFNFGKNCPQYDIWSLGIILYKLIYSHNPFHKSGKTIFSKTILRQYLLSQYQIKYPSQKHDPINKFINKCLSTRPIAQFKNWQEIKKYILEQEQIYHQLDFHDGLFEQMALIHLKTMIFFTSMYCFIIDQCKDSPNPFWRIPISNHKNLPFKILICQFTLTFMKALEQRFYSIYSSHFFLLKKETLNRLLQVSKQLENQLEFKEGRWAEEKMNTNVLTKEVLLIIQDVCVKMKFQGSEENQKIDIQKNSNNQFFDSKRIIELRSTIVRKKKDQPYTSRLANSKKVWKPVQILYDYCSEVLDVVKQNNGRIKYVFQEIYINSIFDAILRQEFNYRKDFSLIFKRVYQNYLNEH